ncbi:MAG: pentapeptide repeat-containing protein, partial [Alphaproteobacteria bacterium]|nr:pentapeptide repeat-containing protein [Alphaproteobacteria bacterium]
MADPAYRAPSPDELRALAKDRVFPELLFSSALSLEGLDLTECRFERCRFQGPTIQSVDFSESEFADCRFEP